MALLSGLVLSLVTVRSVTAGFLVAISLGGLIDGGCWGL